jgi:hypothetical protein
MPAVKPLQPPFPALQWAKHDARHSMGGVSPPRRGKTPKQALAAYSPRGTTKISPKGAMGPKRQLTMGDER